jgi:glycerophosphoryl diester phosphodiesterase
VSDWFRSPTPLIIGHRGASAAAPENTLSAFTLALKQGAHGIELDVRLSADGHPVIIHDATVERTTNGVGQVAALTSNQINELLIDAEHRVPALNQVFEELGAQLLYNIELKTTKLGDPKLAAAVSSCILEHNIQEKVLISSFNPIAVRQVRKHLGPKVPVGLIRQTFLAKYFYLGVEAEADHPNFTLVSKGYMAWARNRGFRVHVWTVDDIHEAQRLSQLGVDAIITNHPALIAQHLVPGKKIN